MAAVAAWVPLLSHAQEEVKDASPVSSAEPVPSGAPEVSSGGMPDAGAGGTAVVPIPVAQDVAYPGAIALKVDLADLDRKVFAVHESIPVKPGPLTLLYPEWLPGSHSPRGRVDFVAGLIIRADGKRIEWRLR